MQRFGLIYSQAWYQQMNSWQRELVRTTLELYSREERLNSSFTDYSFVIFPMAKAYEGFLKDFFYKTGLINKRTYGDKRFRIGRALNPDLHPNRQDEFWLYGEIQRRCGQELARQLWDTWLTCRNQVFHYFPENQRKLSLLDVAADIEKIATTVEQTYSCQWNG